MEVQNLKLLTDKPNLGNDTGFGEFAGAVDQKDNQRVIFIDSWKIPDSKFIFSGS